MGAADGVGPYDVEGPLVSMRWEAFGGFVPRTDITRSAFSKDVYVENRLPRSTNRRGRPVKRQLQKPKCKIMVTWTRV